MTAFLVAGSPWDCFVPQVTGLEAGQAAAVPARTPPALALGGGGQVLIAAVVCHRAQSSFLSLLCEFNSVLDISERVTPCLNLVEIQLIES